MTHLIIKSQRQSAPRVELPTQEELLDIMHAKYGRPEAAGPTPRLWYRYGYATPDEHYEALVSKLIFEGCDWLDVGCGRNMFPGNRQLGEMLARRSGFLMGVDPDPTIYDNTVVHEKQQTTIEALSTNHSFDVITLRMVAEHIARPAEAVAALARLAKSGGRVVIYTVSRWSPLALAAWLVPFRLHNPIKRALWRTEPEDTFTVAYRMNTRHELRRQFSDAGFREVCFTALADCRVFFRFAGLRRLELAALRACHALRVPYPERCILAVYERG